MKLYIVNNNSELLDILNKYDKVIINISAPWCKYCVKILPQSLTYFENIKVNNCAFVYLNKDKFKKLYKLLKLKAIPSFTIYKNNLFTHPLQTSNINILKEYIKIKL